MTVRTPTDVLAEAIDLAGLDVLDVGCGAGDLVRWLRSQGARSWGAECGPQMLGMAVAADPDHAQSYVDATGQDLPFDDASFDLVVFSYSLHHVPIDDMPTAIGEARRVVRRGGTLYVVEPEPISPDNLAAYPAMDERRELAAANDVLDRSAEFGFEQRSRTTYASEGTYASYDSWVEECVGVDQERAELIERHHDQLHEQFHRMGRKDLDGYTFARGNRLAILTAI